MADIEDIVNLLKSNGKGEYLSKLDRLPKEEVILLGETLSKIRLHYDEKYSDLQHATLTAFERILVRLRDKCSVVPYSYTYRLKDVDSLLLKILTKYIDEKIDGCENLTYSLINVDNYYKIVMDLIGFRLLYRYPQEWREIDAHLCGGRLANGVTISDALFENNRSNYVINRIEDYTSVGDKVPFLAEKPKLYYLDTSYVEASAYALSTNAFMGFNHSDEIDSYSAARFHTIPSPQGYRSIHYIINMQGKYVELQVRTLFDEAWAECGHDLVYKSANESTLSEDLIGIYNTTLAHQMGVSRDIAENMYSMIENQQEDVTLLLGLHKIMSRQIKAIGELNAHIAGYINNFPTLLLKNSGLVQETTEEPDADKVDEPISVVDFLNSI